MRTLALVSMTAGLLATFIAGAAGAERLVPGGALPGQREATFSTRGLITHLAADGNRVALMTTKIRAACDRVVVWSLLAGDRRASRPSLGAFLPMRGRSRAR